MGLWSLLLYLDSDSVTIVMHLYPDSYSQLADVLSVTSGLTYLQIVKYADSAAVQMSTRLACLHLE
jgi:hypothetical protein